MDGESEEREVNDCEGGWRDVGGLSREVGSWLGICRDGSLLPNRR